jgi:CheY-like chemotaxis protein
VDRHLAGALLERQAGCAVRYAADGKEALERVAEEVPDLVLADLQMPEMDGLELVRALKRDYPVVPVILMTGHGSEDIAARALSAGAASYVPKRHLASDLVATAYRILLGSSEDRTHSQLMHYLESSEAVFSLGNDLGLLRALVRHVQQVLRCLPLGDETERMRVGLALEEALANAFYHGNLEVGATLGKADRQAYEQLARERLGQEPYRQRRIHVTVRISRAEAVFVVRDEGPGFDTSRAALLDAERDGGRGLVLMRTIMDEVRHNAAGNEVTLIKRRVVEPAATEEEANEPT